MLTACAMGLGTCVISASLPALNVPEMKAQFGIPDKFSAIAPIFVGHPHGETAPTLQKEPLILTYLSTTGDGLYGEASIGYSHGLQHIDGKSPWLHHSIMKGYS